MDQLGVILGAERQKHYNIVEFEHGTAYVYLNQVRYAFDDEHRAISFHEQHGGKLVTTHSDARFRVVLELGKDIS